MKNHPNNVTTAGLLAVILSAILLIGATAIPDPTRPPDALIPATNKIKVTGALTVTAIFVYPNRRFAIINGQMVSVGDKIGEYTIINIQHDTVELKGSKDSSLTLSLLPTVKMAR